MVILERNPTTEIETQKIISKDFDDMMNDSQLLSMYLFFRMNSMLHYILLYIMHLLICAYYYALITMCLLLIFFKHTPQ